VRRLTQALLLALVLVTVQAAILVHDHGSTPVPAGASAQACEFCSAGHSAAPAPDREVAGHFEARPIQLSAAPHFPHPEHDYRAAHRSRAPPAFRST
jgi:hypothetical protein